METPRGFRNKNPGNIRRSGDPWQGLDGNQPDSSFFTFLTMAYGVRASAKILITYFDKHGLNTVNKIINRWAPPVENKTEAYVNSVCRRMGVTPNEPINIHKYWTLRPLCEAIFIHENGRSVNAADIDRGLMMAGIEPPRKNLLKDGKSNSTILTTASGALGTVSMLNDQSRDMMRSFGDMPAWLIGGLFLLGAGWLVWTQVRDRRRGW